MAMNGREAKPPVVLWAQRADKLFLTFEIEDCTNPVIKLEKDKLYFKGKSDSIGQQADHREHEVTLEFHNPIAVDESKHAVRARGIEFVIVKEEPKWWPRLLKDSLKHHWLKIDFPKWKDEDDTDDEAGPGDFGGMGGGGQPDFSQLMQQFGMQGGAGDLGNFGADGDEEEEDDEDEEEGEKMPNLED